MKRCFRIRANLVDHAQNGVNAKPFMNCFKRSFAGSVETRQGRVIARLAKPLTTHDDNVGHLSCDDELYDTEGREVVKSATIASPFVSFRDCGKFGTLHLPKGQQTALAKAFTRKQRFPAVTARSLRVLYCMASLLHRQKPTRVRSPAALKL